MIVGVGTQASTITQRTLTSWVRQKRKTRNRFNMNTRWVAGLLRSITSSWRPYASTAKTGIRSRNMWRHDASKIYVRIPKSLTRNLKNWLMRKEICLQESIGTSRRWQVSMKTAVLPSILNYSWREPKKMRWRPYKIREHLRMNRKDRG